MFISEETVASYLLDVSISPERSKEISEYEATVSEVVENYPDFVSDDIKNLTRSLQNAFFKGEELVLDFEKGMCSLTEEEMLWRTLERIAVLKAKREIALRAVILHESEKARLTLAVVESESLGECSSGSSKQIKGQHEQS